MTSFVVIASDRDSGYPERVIGLYRSFKKAEGDSKAWSATSRKWTYCVMPIEKLEV